MPRCMPIICPTLEFEDPHLTLVEHNTSYGGRAVFRCAWGYRLTAPPGVECEVDGQWSGPVPSCEGEVYTVVVVTSHISAKGEVMLLLCLHHMSVAKVNFIQLLCLNDKSVVRMSL